MPRRPWIIAAVPRQPCAVSLPDLNFTFIGWERRLISTERSSHTFEPSFHAATEVHDRPLYAYCTSEPNPPELSKLNVLGAGTYSHCHGVATDVRRGRWRRVKSPRSANRPERDVMITLQNNKRGSARLSRPEFLAFWDSFANWQRAVLSCFRGQWPVSAEIRPEWRFPFHFNERTDNGALNLPITTQQPAFLSYSTSATSIRTKKVNRKAVHRLIEVISQPQQSMNNSQFFRDILTPQTFFSPSSQLSTSQP